MQRYSPKRVITKEAIFEFNANILRFLIFLLSGTPAARRTFSLQSLQFRAQTSICGSKAPGPSPEPLIACIAQELSGFSIRDRFGRPLIMIRSEPSTVAPAALRLSGGKPAFKRLKRPGLRPCFNVAGSGRNLQRR
jgi:hypothetical protein